jgi:hypothetical protein
MLCPSAQAIVKADSPSDARAATVIGPYSARSTGNLAALSRGAGCRTSAVSQRPHQAAASSTWPAPVPPAPRQRVERPGQQLQRVLVWSAESAALQRTDGINADAGTLGEGFLGESRCLAGAPQQNGKRGSWQATHKRPPASSLLRCVCKSFNRQGIGMKSRVEHLSVRSVFEPDADGTPNSERVAGPSWTPLLDVTLLPLSRPSTPNRSVPRRSSQ